MTIGPLRSDSDGLISRVEADRGTESKRGANVDPKAVAGSSGQTGGIEGNSDSVELRGEAVSVKKGTYSLQEILPAMSSSIEKGQLMSRVLDRGRLEEIRMKIENDFYDRDEVISTIAEKLVDIKTEDN